MQEIQSRESDFRRKVLRHSSFFAGGKLEGELGSAS